MISLLLALLPPFISTPLRRALGSRIAASARIGWLSWIDVRHLDMQAGARIGSLAFVRAQRLEMGPRANIRPLALISSHTVQLGESTHIAPTAIIHGSRTDPKSKLVVGDHSRIFPLCWLEPGEGIILGKHVGIGGHGLIFTHGAWSDYLDGGPLTYAPVTIQDRVWLPWRVTVLAGVTIGADSIVMSGSVVTRSVPANVIAGGTPAKVIRERDPIGQDDGQRMARAREIVEAFGEWSRNEYGKAPSEAIQIDDGDGLSAGGLLFAVSRPVGDDEVHMLVSRGISVVDHQTLTLHQAAPSRLAGDFADFVDRYGIRLYRR